MTISSSLNAGVAGLNANAARLATISDNIANSATFGYKRARTDFQSVVVQGGGTQGIYSAGGVRATTSRLIDQRGPLISTNNPTDLAVNGRGMLPVTPGIAVDNDNGSLPLMLMTTGSFRPDADGTLRTESGHVLLGWAANPDGTIPPLPRDTIAGLRPVNINANQFASNPTTEVRLGINLPATATRAAANGHAQELSVEYFANLGTSESLHMTFEPTVPASGTSNEWTLTVRDSASGDAVVGQYVLAFDDGPTLGGTLSSVTQTAGAPGDAYDPATGNVTVLVEGGRALGIDIGEIGGRFGLTQVSDRFEPVLVSKNGAPVGNLVAVDVDANGFVRALYDAGFTRTLFQVPLVDVPNPNGLIPMSNQAYRVSVQSGPFFLWDAGDGPTGAMVGYAREESATDVAAELTQMIQTQRAYSSNAKVIQTADEMLQETTNIKR
jgi:flagellar hook protein FlgE